MATIEQLKQKHQGEWLAISVLKEGEAGPDEGDLVYHSANRDEVWRRIKGDPRKIYVTYGGPALEEGYAVAF